MNKTRSLTLPFGLGQASFWMSVCITLSFAAVHLKALGFSNTELGLVMAVGNILGALLGPLLASLAETHPRLHTAGLIWPLFALRALFLGGLLFCTKRSFVSAALYAFYLAVTMAVNSLNLKFCVDAEQRGMALDYGRARAAGSLAFVLISALLGLLVKRWSYFALIWAGFAVLLLQAAANALTDEALKLQPLPKQRESQQSSMSLPAFLKAEPRFAGFLLGSILLYFAHNTITNYMINIVRNVGGDEETMGYLNAFMAVVEVPVMLLFSRFSKGRRVSVLLHVSVAMFLCKALAFAFAPSIGTLFAATLLQAPSFALYTSAIVPYVSAVIAEENAAKAQSLAFSMTTLGAVGASFVGGLLYDHTTTRVTLLVAAAVCAVGVLVCLFSIRQTARLPKDRSRGKYT